MRPTSVARLVLFCACLAVAQKYPMAAAGQMVPRHEQAALRRPVALAWLDRASRLCVANRCGTISLVDVERGRVISETPIGAQLAALCASENGQLLAVDFKQHRVLRLSLIDDHVQVHDEVTVSAYPVEVIYDRSRRQAYVSSLWSRRVTRLDCSSDSLRVTGQLDIPFPARNLILSPDGQCLVVADAFGGRLGLVDVNTFRYKATRSFPAHNIRGLASSVDGSMLVVAHQMLNDLAHTTRNDVHWGLLMSNDLRWLRWDAVLSENQDIYAGSHMHPLGEAGGATADPSGLAMAPSGVVVVTLGGVGEVAVGRESDFTLFRLRVGRRPTAVLVQPDGQRAIIANTFDDSLTVLDLASRQVVCQIELGPMAPLTLVDQGELLFYDGRLSHDGWMSCHSCHTDGHTNGGLNDNFSDLTFGAPKRVLSLLGVARTAPYGWLGRLDDLPTQIKNSIRNTMQGERELTDDEIQSLVAFLSNLEVPPSLDELRGSRDLAAIERGRRVFEQRQCARCHEPPDYTSAKSYDVGLVDQRGNRQFNPPSLRGLSHRGPYLHDNAASQLEDVFRVFAHPNDAQYEDDELQDLVAFLRSL